MPTLLSRVSNKLAVYSTRFVTEQPEENPPRELYNLLEAYYLNNGLYDYQALAMYEDNIWKEALKGLRTVARRTVEFHVMHVWPGLTNKASPLEAAGPIIDPIKQIWAWSNWGNNKQLAVRQLAKYGDMFIKVVSEPERSMVYFQLIDPANVSRFNVDNRGFITYTRLDIPVLGKNYTTHTEVWDKESLTYTVWHHRRGVDASLEALGTPLDQRSLLEFGIDFIPFVHAKFIDNGEKRGMGSFALALDKIDEANRKATRLAQMIFRYNKAIWAISANMLDASGRPLPAPRIDGASGAPGSDTITLGDDEVVRLPGMSSLDSLVPNINYSAHLEALKGDMLELEEELPELTYYRLKDAGNLSGRALQLLLAAAISKALEARGNAEAALIQADMMALTMAQSAQLSGFEERAIGNFESGAFEHGFRERDVIPISSMERAQEGKIYVEMGLAQKTALRYMGKSADEIELAMQEIEESKAAEKASLAESILQAQRTMDSGQQSNGLERE